ncbi:predicted protein [Uncinocarpus reesii 1704]|uniref:C2H2-type domain-containing protein n=1 Tax=Uncinocarpus reesii (strain UAMH 1704) TaxID=336963 RepID=C4JNV0_UNCRE|nr:uncharacterized protein UREG_04420 [Uncinocarpus reesii 1704]EEP79574.1 predicted protein [Uncinocarpus reesii 1704]
MSPSVAGTGLTGSLTRPRLAVKRARDPPRNAGGQIYCDHPDCYENAPVFRRPCEWNSGKGFTRQENLNEHLRRLHRGSQDLTVPPTPRSPPSSAKTVEETTSSALAIHSAMKRKRASSGSENDSETTLSNIQALREEVVRLRSQIQQKDSRLDELEKVVRELRQSINLG